MKNTINIEENNHRMNIERKYHNDRGEHGSEYLLIHCDDYIVELACNYIVYRFGNEDKRMSNVVNLFPVIENTWNDMTGGAEGKPEVYNINIKMKGVTGATHLELTYFYPSNYEAMFDFLAKGLGLFLQAGELLSKK